MKNKKTHEKTQKTHCKPHFKSDLFYLISCDFHSAVGSLMTTRAKKEGGVAKGGAEIQVK